jgi:hypothetical protein
VCRSVRIGVVVYNRKVCRLSADTLERLATSCPNLVGFEDGIGEIELMVAIRRWLGGRPSRRPRRGPRAAAARGPPAEAEQLDALIRKLGSQ